MTLKLNGSSSGSVAIDAPASTTGGADRTVTCPDANGTMALTSNILFSSYAIIEEQQAHDANSGTFTQDAWQTRLLNTEVADPDSIVSISSNQFTLQAGTYLLKWSAPARDLTHHQTRIYNSTDSSVVRYGSSEYSNTLDAPTTSTGVARVTIAGAKAFELQHYGWNTSNNTGFGIPANSTGATEHYSIVEIYKEA